MKKVLIVDDDPIFNFLHARMLAIGSLAETVESALNGRQALEILQNNRHALPEVILLDLTMPEMDGFGFLQAVKELNIPGIENISIVVITSSINPKDSERVRALGVSHYLVKPISLDILRDVFDACALVKA